MPIYSMTGYATACTTPNTAPTADKPEKQPPVINVEARSVNSRFLDPHLKMPDEIRASEPSLRTLISQKLRRGKVELRISLNYTSDQLTTQVSMQSLQNLSRLGDTIRNWLPDVRPLSITDVIHLSQQRIVLEDVQEQILQTVSEALDQLIAAREVEGKRLANSIFERTKILKELAQKAQPLIPQVVEQQRLRFLERWNQTLESAQVHSSNISAEAVQERALAEVTSYTLRIDVAEELTRLDSHLNEIERLLKKGGEAGKRLDFLIQELHREANTLGSKSTSIELTQISMEMKVLIEQMREQVQNIE